MSIQFAVTFLLTSSIFLFLQECDKQPNHARHCLTCVQLDIQCLGLRHFFIGLPDDNDTNSCFGGGHTDFIHVGERRRNARKDQTIF